MTSKYVTYKVKAGEVEAVLVAIKEFVAAIAKAEPATRYEAFQAADGVNFMHTMRFIDEAAAKQHSDSDYTKKFVEVLYPRCEVAPQFTDITELASTD